MGSLRSLVVGSVVASSVVMSERLADASPSRMLCNLHFPLRSEGDIFLGRICIRRH